MFYSHRTFWCFKTQDDEAYQILTASKDSPLQKKIFFPSNFHRLVTAPDHITAAASPHIPTTPNTWRNQSAMYLLIGKRLAADFLYHSSETTRRMGKLIAFLIWFGLAFYWNVAVEGDIAIQFVLLVSYSYLCGYRHNIAAVVGYFLKCSTHQPDLPPSLKQMQ